MILFNRYKNCRVTQVDEHHVEVVSAMGDTYHEINIALTVSLRDLTITKAIAQYLRSPYELCREGSLLMENLVGTSLGKGITKAAHEKVGGPNGCTHLVDLVIEAAKALLQAQYVLKFQKIKDRKVIQDTLNNDFRDNCLYYTRTLNKVTGG